MYPKNAIRDTFSMLTTYISFAYRDFCKDSLSLV